MANITYTITQDGDEISYTINDGVGPAGPAGPSNITTATETDITGILKGDGANVSAAVEDTDYQGVPAEGAFVDGDKTKLDGIEAGATGDQTGAEIKSLYEAEADTNAFTDAEKSKLAGIEAGADVTDAANVDAAGAVMESDYSPAHSVLAQQSGTGSPSSVSLGTDSLLGRASGAGTAIQGLTAAQARTLLNVEDGATADQTAAEILTAIKTVDGTGSGLDADLLDGQEASAFATAAQGTLADSAVQPGDIDTLAELNAIITDATLIDTTDSRLSDARTPTAHTHTVEDLDFAGSTEIGADLADADEVLVSDGGGNTTRVKSALSRFWTYIKAKIESVGLSSLNISGNLTVGSGTWDGATISGNQSFSGQVELTGQAASTDDSAMTRSLVDEWGLDNIGRIFNLTLADLSLASSGTGAGATATSNGIRLSSGTSTSGYGQVDLMSGTGGWAYSAPFQRPMAAAFAITFSPASVTDTGSGIRIGFGINRTASWDSNGLTGKGFGFEYEPDGTNHRIRAIAHDGTTFTAGSWVNIGTGGISAGHRGLLIESDGAGNISVTITAAYGDTSTTYTATTTGGPTSTASGTQAGLSAVACNESTGTPALIGCDIKAARVKLD